MKTLQDFNFGESAYERPDQKWVCGHIASGKPCRIGPDGRGRCQATFECVPSKSGDTWLCRRPESAGGACEHGPGPDGACCNPIPQCAPRLSVAAKRARVVKWAMSIAVGFVAILAAYAGKTHFLTPGPLTAAHSALSNCGVCHAVVADGKFKFDWLHSIFTDADPKKSASACLSCHNMDTTALNPHGLALNELERRTSAKRKASATEIAPMSLWIRNAVFSTEELASSQVFCTTCHKEHQGERFPITDVINAQCQTCHAVQFASFEDGHPDDGTYPFDRRTRINFDHTKHFKIHFPEAASKTGGRTAQPDACGDCHVPGPGNRQMIVQPFEQMCSSCHLGQILGAEAGAEPLGVSLFSLPGLDLASLRDKDAQIGEWPEDAFALGTEMSPLLRLFIGSDEAGRALLAEVEKLDLVELETASAEDVMVVEEFVWQVKELIHAFATAKISDSDLVRTFTRELKLQSVDQQLLTELTASIPLDVWSSAQREWLPDLAREISLHRAGKAVPIPDPPPIVTEQKEKTKQDTGEPEPNDESEIPGDDSSLLGVINTDEPSGTDDDGDLLGGGNTETPSGAEDDNSLLGGGDTETPSSTEDDSSLLGGGDTETPSGTEDDSSLLGGGDTETPSGAEDDNSLLGGGDTETPSSAEDDNSLLGGGDTETPSGGEDDNSLLGGDGTESPNGSDQQSGDETVVTEAGSLSISPEEWAEFGGWYRQDFEIRYKPSRHSDRFVRSWLDFTGVLMGLPQRGLADPVFRLLTKKGAPGQCAKCHSIEGNADGALSVKWTPLTSFDQAGEFTRFSHEPHFSIKDDRGCLTCHDLNPEADYAATYKAYDPNTFQSNFKPIEQAFCRECHTASGSGDDCQLCHAYHVTEIDTQNMAHTTKSEVPADEDPAPTGSDAE